MKNIKIRFNDIYLEVIGEYYRGFTSRDRLEPNESESFTIHEITGDYKEYFLAVYGDTEKGLLDFHADLEEHILEQLADEAIEGGYQL